MKVVYFTSSKMKILYEVSTLGHSYIGSNGNSGIFRVTEDFVQEIVNSKDIESKFISNASIIHAIKTKKYFQSKYNPTLANSLIDSLQSYSFLTNFYENLFDRGKYLSQQKSILKNDLIIQKYATKLCLRLLPKIDKYFSLKEEFDIYHSFYYPLLNKEKVKTRCRILTIHDVIPYLFPQYFKPSTTYYFNKIMSSLDPSKDWVICFSDSTKRDICKVTSISYKRVFVLPLSSDRLYKDINPEKISFVKKKYSIPNGDYVLCLSTVEPRKNIKYLIESFIELVSRFNISNLYLVLAGSNGWLYNSDFDKFNKNFVFLNNVIFTGFVEEEDLVYVYSAAKIFVYPSLYEGFGLPVLEAMKCGLPVITSNRSSLPELVGNAGILVDPQDKNSLCLAMYELIKDDSKLCKYSNASLCRAKEYSMNKSFTRMLDIYNEVLRLSN
ncbi:MAG: glycosyltransferase family 1 protein [Thermosynechococcaceae cyanobacterium]